MTATKTTKTDQAAGKLDARSRMLRGMVIDALDGGGRGHPGAALSLIEIVRVLYDDVLRYRAEEPDWAERDRCILSKGHGCLALYAILADKGFFPVEELHRQCHLDAMLGGHPEAHKIPGVEASTGALGHGLPIGVGLALAARLQGRDSRVFVIMGDGEINEGSVWEAAMCAAKHGLDNLVAVIDRNKLQSYGPTAEVLDLEPLAEKWSSFGFAVHEAEGHDVDSLREGFAALPYESGKSNLLICHTVKGRGIAEAEHNPSWHHKARLSPEQVAELRKALEEN
jgi:transketolase|tara:strand:- start:4835 stop:5683 length:849 start_codon:yes stop_codon:yes gene_type:complete